MKKLLALVLAVLMTAAFFAGCSSKEPADNTDPSGSAAVSKDSLVVALVNEPTQLDPQYSADSYGSLVIYNTHDPLVRRNPAGELEPCLAESWEISEDGMIVTLKIRQGVKFQDGSELTAEDVAFSLNRAIEIPQSEAYSESFKEARVVDESTVELELLFPDIAVIALLSQANNCIVSKKIVESVGSDEYTNNICGTGAYKLVEWQKGSKLVFEANEDYWGGAPAIKHLELRILKESTTQLVALQTGDVDLIMNMSALDSGTVKNDSKLAYDECSSTIIWNVGFNTQKAPLDNAKVRKALVMAVNKEDVIMSAADGAGVPANIILTATTAGNPGEENVDTIPYDPEGAKALLAEAGYPNGEGLEITLCVREDATKKMGTVIQSNWEAIGVKTNVNVMERSALLADMQAGKLEAYIAGNVSLTLDASLLLSTLATDKIPATNTCFFSNEEYDKLYSEQGMCINDPEKRIEIIKQMLNIEAEEAPRLLLYYPISNIGYAQGLNIEVCPTVESYFFARMSWN